MSYKYKEIYSRICSYEPCGKSFKTAYSTKIYCSSECQVKENNRKFEEKLATHLKKAKETAYAEGFKEGHKTGYELGYKKGLKERQEIDKNNPRGKPQSIMDRTARPPDKNTPRTPVEIKSGAGRSTMGGW